MMQRRTFLKTSGAFTGFASLHALGYRAQKAVLSTTSGGGYGPLRPAGRDLALPEGFSYSTLGVAGSIMSDGNVTPGAHDGMAAFALPNGNIRLIRNHEIGNKFPDRSLPNGGSRTYDTRAGGGTTSLEVDPTSRELVRDFLSLDGTSINCAGGPTPWGSWLSCEESFFGTRQGFDQLHGYIFEVPSAAEGLVDPTPLTDMGRFVHEAVAVDPATGIVYETEDMQRSGLFRFLPNEPYRGNQVGNLTAGGRLQMLAIRGQPQYDTSQGQQVGRALPVEWVDIEEPNPTTALAASTVFLEGWEKGGARFRRLEGAWFDNGNLIVDCTEGGDAGCGQIWRYQANGAEAGQIELVFESPSPSVLDHPDNICGSPRGGLVLCEDGEGQNLFLRGLTPDGKLFDFAQNVLNDSEFAGSTFSPDGQTLFVNIQRPGLTLAIWGPWERGAL